MAQKGLFWDRHEVVSGVHREGGPPGGLDRGGPLFSYCEEENGGDLCDCWEKHGYTLLDLVTIRNHLKYLFDKLLWENVVCRWRILASEKKSLTEENEFPIIALS